MDIPFLLNATHEARNMLTQGDRINFGIAAEKAKNEGRACEMVVVADDCALPKAKGTANTGVSILSFMVCHIINTNVYVGITGGRGIAGTVLVHKLTGAAAEESQTLPEVTKIANHAIGHVRSLGVALSTCALPVRCRRLLCACRVF